VCGSADHLSLSVQGLASQKIKQPTITITAMLIAVVHSHHDDASIVPRPAQLTQTTHAGRVIAMILSRIDRHGL
jgi:hypothetical protein